MRQAAEAGLFNNLGLGCFERGNWVAGEALLRRSAALAPDQPYARVNLARHLACDGRADEAEALLEGAPADRPDVIWARAFIALYRRDYARAAELFGSTAPPDPANSFDVCAAMAQTGDWTGAFQVAERLERNWGPAPRWTGDRIDSLLVWADQGVGDIINFARLLPLIRDRVGAIVFAVPWELVDLMAPYRSVAHVISQRQPIPETAAQISLFALLRLLGVQPGSVPPDPGLLRGAWHAVPRNICRVGLCWRGNKVYARDRWRSMDLTTMLPLVSLPGCTFHSLQFGSDEIVRHGLQALISDHQHEMAQGWLHTAGLISAMGAVVTVDTAIAHLAGALGVPTILCLPFLPDWRWGVEGEECEWYPSVALVRQQRPGDWAGVIERVRSIL